MKAAQINEYGIADRIEIHDIDKPSANEGQVIVAVKAASLNPFDIAVLSGQVGKTSRLESPITLGGDIAGIVELIGQGVDDLKIGDIVFGSALTLAGGSGALAEFAVTPAKNLAIAPSNIDFAEAASLPLVGASAVQALYDHMNLRPGQKLFVNGGRGGIGTMAIQIGKHIGAHVAASIHGGDVAKIKSLGADEVIDSSTQDFATVLTDFDAVLNLVRDADFDRFIAILKHGGVIVSLTGAPDGSETNEKNANVIRQMTNTTVDRLNKLRELIEQGVVKPVIASTFTLDQTRQAFEYLQSHGKTGKIVVTIE